MTKENTNSSMKARLSSNRSTLFAKPEVSPAITAMLRGDFESAREILKGLTDQTAAREAAYHRHQMLSSVLKMIEQRAETTSNQINDPSLSNVDADLLSVFAELCNTLNPSAEEFNTLSEEFPSKLAQTALSFVGCKETAEEKTSTATLSAE